MNRTPILTSMLFCLLAIPMPAMAQAQEKEAFKERLQIGEKAPALDVAHWLTKPEEKITKFEPGHIYVIDFWGTWCGACVGEMPKLAEIQKEFADRKVTIISVTDETTEVVNEFLDRSCHHNDKMTYRELTSTYRLAADPDGSVFDAYMKGVAKRSFPMMAIVGKTGLIEYLGSTNGLKRSLKAIVAGNWDRDSIRKEQLANWNAREVMMKVNELRRDGNIDDAIELLNQQFEQANLELRAISYRLMQQTRSEIEDTDESTKRLNVTLRSAAIECIRWERNRFGFLVSQRSSVAVKPFRDLVAAYKDSPNDQLNLAWQVYSWWDMGSDIDMKLLVEAKAVAKAVSASHPDDAISLEVYAHLQHAAGETDAAIESKTG